MHQLMRQPQDKKRFRDYGFSVGLLPPGKFNSITDVAGVIVGHWTKIEEKSIRTGVTIIDPGAPSLFKEKIPGAIAVGNGFGKITGITQVEELGTIEAPIALTNTLALGAVIRGIVDIVIKENPDMSPTATVNAIVGETNDGFLNDIHRNTITSDDVAEAYASRSLSCEEGNVGAGTGTRAFAWKGGIGTSSRSISLKSRKFTLGVLVQTNYGGSLIMNGVPIGEIFGKNDFNIETRQASDGSCIIVVGTDAPFTSRQLRRIAARTFLGLGRTGSVMAPQSGDYAIAFTTSRAGLEGAKNADQCLSDDNLALFFLAAVEATEEAVYNALFGAETLYGRGGNCLEELPKEDVVAFLKKYQEVSGLIFRSNAP